MSDTEEIERGDYLTFASIGNLPGWKSCELRPGIYRRHPDLDPSESRSDISRDGYLGVLWRSLVDGDTARIDRILGAILKTGGTVGERGNFDYINILPLLPLFLAARFKLMPFLPLWIPEQFTTGFRAHLVALSVMIELESGCSGWTSQRAIRKLVSANPENPLFLSILCRMLGTSQTTTLDLLAQTPPETSPHGWGSCPFEIFKTLTQHNIGNTNYGR